MTILKISTPLRGYTNSQVEVNVGGNNVSEVMHQLVEKYPILKPHLYDGGGQLRLFVNLFTGENNINDLQDLDTPVDRNIWMILVPSIAGG